MTEFGRDVEMELTQRLASLEATLAGFAKDVSRRFDAADENLTEIKTQVTRTNGRVNDLERINAVREALAKVESPSRAVEVGSTSVITITDLKWWIAIAMGSSTVAVSVTLWVLKIAGKL
ncbi:MAG: hypothetical protein ABS36_11080 [Acidobacteria bacterium SCN 69-37]|nr:MAG: hypothetical protein ABS36_11080 [Acidobacteria bacterium SCN 69-37]